MRRERFLARAGIFRAELSCIQDEHLNSIHDHESKPRSHTVRSTGFHGLRDHRVSGSSKTESRRPALLRRLVRLVQGARTQARRHQEGFRESADPLHPRDQTDDFTKHQSALHSKLLGVADIYAEQGGKTGYMLLIDAKDKKVLGKLMKTQSEEELKAAIESALKG